MDLVFHHTGLLVKDIESSRRRYGKLFSEEVISPVYTVTSQEVRVCFVRVGEAAWLELVEPFPGQSALASLMDRRVRFYHMGFFTPDIDEALVRLEGLGYKQVNRFESEAFGGSVCAFLYSPEMELIELIAK